VHRVFQAFSVQPHRTKTFKLSTDPFFVEKVRDTRIQHFVEHYNRSCRPFAWTATADSIFGKLARLCSSISGTPH
jgi:hypothetical protein